MLAHLSKFFRLLFFRLSQAFRPRSSARIFVYFDGQRWRSIDPIAALYALETHPKYSPEKHLEEAAKGDRQAIETIADAVCDVFGVKPFDGGQGLTIAERKGLLDVFYLYLDVVKKNIEPG